MLEIRCIKNFCDLGTPYLHLTTDPDGVVPRERQLGLVIHFDGLVLRSASPQFVMLGSANLAKDLVSPACLQG